MEVLRAIVKHQSYRGIGEFSPKRVSLSNALKNGLVLTPEKILQLLSYDRETGSFFWRVSPKNRTPIGSKAGSDTHGYIEICLFGVRCRAHWLVWFLENGEWPLDFVIDHINRDRADNRIVNLRKCNQSQNVMNRCLKSTPKSGRRGVSKHKYGLWRSRVSRETKYFNSLDEAAAHYNARAKEVYGDFFDGGADAVRHP